MPWKPGIQPACKILLFHIIALCHVVTFYMEIKHGILSDRKRLPVYDGKNMQMVFLFICLI